MANSKPYRVFKSYRCEEGPTGFCGFYQLPQSLEILEATLAGGLSIVFNRQVRGLDVSLPLDPRQTAAANPSQFNAFNSCIGLVLQNALQSAR
jgi:hypothetical protein